MTNCIAWNPVKELKVVLILTGTGPHPLGWNPVKELKGSRQTAGSSQIARSMWNPVKELKVVGEGVEIAPTQGDRVWNPVKELKADRAAVSRVCRHD